MKLLGGTDDGGGRGQPGRSQDDAAIGYHPHEPEFPQFAHKHQRWATGDDAIIDVSAKLYLYNYCISLCLFHTSAHIYIYIIVYM